MGRIGWCLGFWIMLGGAAPAARAEIGVEVVGQLGAFGLFNLDGEFTAAAPSFGATVAVDARVTAAVAVGGEVACVGVKSERGRRHHAIVNPAARVRVRVPIVAALDAELQLALGAAWWPADDAEAALHPALAGARWGWSLRVGAGLAWSAGEGWSVVLDAGYAVSSTWTPALAATVDGLVVRGGVRWRL